MSDRARVLCVAALIALTASALAAQTVDEIVAKNIASRGGAEKWKSIESMKMTGTINAGGRTIDLIAWTKRPNLSRQEMSSNGEKAVQAFDGTRFWVMPPGAPGPQEMKGPPAELAKAQSEFDSVLFDYKNKGATVELVGRESDEGRAVYHLKITRKGGAVQHYFLDADTGIERKITSTLNGPNGQTATATIEFGDFRNVDGVMVPYTIKNLVDGRPVSQVTVSTIEFNVPIENDLFRMPTK
ncbi:MAG: hypothetical protein HOQ29_07220 [Acidobacteria bacterium]|nr:hypothetical protein [Acidobacteriota bacterium]